MNWLGCQGSNLGMVESKSTALPLGYTPSVRCFWWVLRHFATVLGRLGTLIAGMPAGSRLSAGGVTLFETQPAAHRSGILSAIPQAP